jgi:hypothetical protein
MNRKSNLLLILRAPAIFLGIGLVSAGYFYWTGAQAGKLVHLSTKEFLAKSANASTHYAEITGKISDQIVSRQEAKRTIPTLYVPVAEEFKQGTPIQLIIEIRESDVQRYIHRLADSDSIRVRGLIEHGIPGDIKFQFEKQNVIVADNNWVIRPKVNPESRKQSSFFILIPFVIISVAALISNLRNRQHAAT